MKHTMNAKQQPTLRLAAQQMLEAYDAGEGMATAIEYMRDHLREPAVTPAEQQIETLQLQQMILLDALEFYAFTINRRKSDGEPFFMHALDLDCGDRARAAIASIKEAST